MVVFSSGASAPLVHHLPGR